MHLSRYTCGTSFSLLIVQREQEEKLRKRATAIQSFPITQYKQTDFPECCPICLDPYKDSCEVKVLPCGHNYHPACISSWLTQNVHCPLCKTNVIRNQPV